MTEDDLSRFSWHTGARLRRVDPARAPAILFRDLGAVVLARYLRCGLERLAGPYTPLLYMRDAGFREPYTDHAGTGRMAILAPVRLGLWESGIPGVYVARADVRPADHQLGYVPGDANLRAISDGARAGAWERVQQLDELLGGRLHEQRTRSDLATLDALNEAAARVESKAVVLRRALQRGSERERELARRQMEVWQIDDEDLCAAWHHLPVARREHLARVFEAWEPRMVAP